ncbi:hypothetical protein AB2N04_03925 [Nitratireductor sp. GISD-1A_MAKvit]|uniref:hypothetical protein n=1 Tax=Nitratireductor sp. GISD-1A_MAKvit TaxID=3234198 RepID=UPI0034654524
MALMVAQTVFEDWWRSGEKQQQAQLARQQTEIIHKSIDAIEKSARETDRNARAIDQNAEKIREQRQLMANLEQRMREEIDALARAPGLRQTPPPPQDVNVPTPETSLDEPTDPPPGTLPMPPASTTRPEEVPASNAAPSMAEPPAPKNSATTREKVFGVFEGQLFTLCGHADFKADVIGHGDAVQLSSRNRDIPGAGFRGYEKRLPLKQAAELWSGCSIAIGEVETKGPANRLIISVVEGKQT